MFFSSLFLVNAVLANDDFPGRKLYQQINTLSKEELYKKMNNEQVVVVDVRSAYEYKTLKILNSINLPVAEKNFHL